LKSHHIDIYRMKSKAEFIHTEAFGLYALSGKATSFLAPALIAIATDMFDSQRLGITPIILLFLIGMFLLPFVKQNRIIAKR
ncbi:MAG: MFS transporter, partial [Pseudomonadota bacterium]